MAERFNLNLHVPHRLRRLEASQVEVRARDGAEIEPPIKVHQRVDEELAPARPLGGVVIPEVTLERGGDRRVDDALRARGAAPRVRDEIEVVRAFGLGAEERHGAEVGAVAIERSDVLEEVRVADAVMRVDAEAETSRDAHGHAGQARDRGQARHVLRGRAESVLVAAHEDVGAAVDEDDRVDRVLLHDAPICGARRLYTHLVDGVDGRARALLVEPTREEPLGKIGVFALRLAGDARERGRHARRVGAAEVREREVGEHHLLAGASQRARDRHAREHVEAAAGSGDEHAARAEERTKRRRVEQRHAEQTTSPKAPRCGRPSPEPPDVPILWGVGGKPGRYLAREPVEVGDPRGRGSVHGVDVDARIPTSDDVSQADGAGQGARGRVGDRPPRRERLERRCESLRRWPPFVRDEVRGDVGAALDGEHEIERDEIQRVSVGTQLLRRRRTQRARSRRPVRELRELHRDERDVHHGAVPPARFRM